jgi:MSHA biogenesis protein MshJ|tara:strand:- start:63 stop:710 length:648 start_codon:yes stop_codon:yes gene_type:complete
MRHILIDGWETLSVRLNALRLRERVLLFLALIAISTFMINVLWVSPAQLLHKELQQRFDTQSADLQRMRAQLKPDDTSVDAYKMVRDEMTAVKVSLDKVNNTISNVSSMENELPLEQVLVRLLSQYEGLTLLSTSMVVSKMAIDKLTQVAAQLPVAQTQQSVELTVSGSYSQLMRYVQTLEKELTHVRWGSMNLISENPPTTLTLELFVVGEYKK